MSSNAHWSKSNWSKNMSRVAFVNASFFPQTESFEIVELSMWSVASDVYQFARLVGYEFEVLERRCSNFSQAKSALVVK